MITTNNIEYRDLFLKKFTNENTNGVYKTALNVFLDVKGLTQPKNAKTLKNFNSKSVLDFEYTDFEDFFNLLNQDKKSWSLASKRVMLPKVKSFLNWILKNYKKQLIGDLTGIDEMNKRMKLMDLKEAINDEEEHKFAKDGHKTSNSNKSVYLKIEELKDLFKAIMDYPNDFDKAKPVYNIMYQLLTETGCRITEFCSIVLDAKINSHVIPIEQDLNERKIRVKWIKTEDKDQKGFRFYPISEAFKEVLLNYVSGRRAENLKDKDLPNFLFVTKMKTKMTDQNMYYNVKRYCKLAGITKSISAHVFRHSLNVHRAKLKCPEDVRAILLNHGTGNINTDTYYKESLEWVDILKMYDDFYPYKEVFK